MEMKFLDTLSENTETSNLVKIRPVGAEMFHAYRQTDKANSHNFLIFRTP
jgi:hypothetical protein